MHVRQKNNDKIQNFEGTKMFVLHWQNSNNMILMCFRSKNKQVKFMAETTNNKFFQKTTVTYSIKPRSFQTRLKTIYRIF